jgi:hypothetical protein
MFKINQKLDNTPMQDILDAIRKGNRGLVPSAWRKLAAFRWGMKNGISSVMTPAEREMAWNNYRAAKAELVQIGGGQ